MTQDGDHVADDEDVENQGPQMGQVLDSITTGRIKRNSRKLAWLIFDMIVTYALPVIEESISSTYREVEISSESEMWKNAMLEEWSLFIRMTLENF